MIGVPGVGDASDTGGGGSDGEQSAGRDPIQDGSSFRMSVTASYDLGTNFRDEPALVGSYDFSYNGMPYDGPGAGLEMVLRAWLSTNNRIDGKDYLVEEFKASLQYNSTGTISSSGFVDLPDGITAGSYQIIFESEVRAAALPDGAQTSLTWKSRPNGMDDIVIGDGAPVLDATRDLFRDAGGKTAFLADLALAAYRLDTENGHEQKADGVNVRKGPAEKAYADLPDGLRLLTESDLPGIDLSEGSDLFPKDGIANGIYTGQNAAALVARSEDALFVAFRGTNDNGSDPALDTVDWLDISRHHDKFGALFVALHAYVRANDDIEDIYLTGHSLGGAMVERTMQKGSLGFKGVGLEAVTFASPGAKGETFDYPEQTMSNFRISGDFVPWANAIYDTSGDIATIYTSLLATLRTSFDRGIVESRIDLHSMNLYREFVDFFAAEGVLSTRKNGLDYDVIRVEVRPDDVAEELYSVGAYNDHISGTNLSEIILGGDGQDTLDGGGGADWLLGGTGRDRILGRKGADVIEGGDGSDVILAHKGTDTLHGDDGADTMFGGGDGDHLFGGKNADTLRGENGTDYLFGDGGQDTLDGGAGRDWLEGGAGSDMFLFANHKHTKGKSADRITDWDAGGAADKIDLSAIDAATGALRNLGDQAFRWIGDFEFSNFKGELRYGHAGSRTIIEGDRDGDGAADFEIVLGGLHDLTYDDFVL